jgi:hypothetical protein
MCALFVEALMEHIMEGVMIPKVQIERVVGPILGMFLEDVLSETLKDDPVLSGALTMICPEFPLKKSDNRQSTNIDWLMYNSERKQLLFVELKTSDTSVDAGQNAIYRAKQQTVRSEGGSFLIEDLKQMSNASNESGKYRYILEKRVLPFKNHIDACHDAKLVYILPKSVEHKHQDYADRVLSFALLSNSIKGPFASEWSIIRSRLCAIDDSSQRARNRQSETALKTDTAANFAGLIDFQSIMELCKKRGDAVMVGFAGGDRALASRDLASLENRWYKWDNVVGGIGSKDLSNWIRGTDFIKIIDGKNSNSV